MLPMDTVTVVLWIMWAVVLYMMISLFCFIVHELLSTVLLWITWPVILYMIISLFCWIMLDLLSLVIAITAGQAEWAIRLFIYIYTFWYWSAFDQEVWIRLPVLFGPGVEAWVFLLVWALPDRVAVVRPDLAQNWFR